MRYKDTFGLGRFSATGSIQTFLSIPNGKGLCGMGDKGKKDKGKRENQKKSKSTLKEKRKQKSGKD
ncbi:MAG: hypothetical protein R6U40_01400 [Desulfobacterales bacterium]